MGGEFLCLALTLELAVGVIPCGVWKEKGSIAEPTHWGGGRNSVLWEERHLSGRAAFPSGAAVGAA